MVTVEGLVKRYGDLIAVNGIDLEVRAGETFGLLGPNGAGKTTTIQMLVGALRPDGGRVRLNGVGDPMLPKVRRQLGVAPQSLSLYLELTAEENLRFFARMYGMAGRQLTERVNWALEFAGLTDRRRDRVSTYSGGMQRRLNLACALVHDPRLLLLDEPTVGVDPQSRNHLFERVEQLKAEGRTILYTTHYMEEAARLCDRVAIMDRGKLLALDSVERLIAQHGGRAVITAALERLPADAGSLPGTLEGLSLRFESTKPFEEVARLSSVGVAFARLRVDRPDLESVFLTLTGRSLRD